MRIDDSKANRWRNHTADASGQGAAPAPGTRAMRWPTWHFAVQHDSRPGARNVTGSRHRYGFGCTLRAAAIMPGGAPRAGPSWPSRAWHDPSSQHAAKATVAVAAFALASIAHGQVYKCTDGTGRTIYSDAPCDAAAKPLKLPDDPKKNVTNPHMCAQLLDETRRLAAEAERDARRGRTESADDAKLRQTMTRRYEERCVGIADPRRSRGRIAAMVRIWRCCGAHRRSDARAGNRASAAALIRRETDSQSRSRLTDRPTISIKVAAGFPPGGGCVHRLAKREGVMRRFLATGFSGFSPLRARTRSPGPPVASSPSSSDRRSAAAN